MFVPKTFKPLQQTSASQPTQGGFVPKTFVPEKKTIGGFLGNVGKSAIDTVGGITSSVVNVLNPDMEKNTVANLARVGMGTAQLLDTSQRLGTGQEETARNVGRFYDNRYGISDLLKGDLASAGNKIGNTAYYDPVGTALDVSAVVGGAGGLAKGVAGLSTRGASSVSLASNAARLGKAGSTLTRASQLIDPIQASAKITGAGMGKLAKYVSPKLEAGSDAIILRGAGKPTTKLTDTAKRAKTTPQRLIKKYNVFDRSSETAGAAKSGVLSSYDDIALNSGSQIPVSDIVQAFNKEIDNLRQGVGGEIADSDVSKIAELERRRDQLLRAVGQTPDSTPLFADTSTVTNFRKKVIDPDVPVSQFGLDAKGSGAAQGVKKSRDILRRNINATDPRLEQLGLDYGALKELEKYLKAGESRGQGKQMFNFSRLGGAGLAGLVAGAPGVVGGFLAEQMVNDPRFLKFASQGMSGASQRLKNPVGNPIADKVASGFYNFGRAGNQLNPERTTTEPTEEISNQTLEESPYLPQIITPPVKPAYNFKQKVIKKPKNVFSKEQGGGNPFGAVQSAYKRFGNTVADVADNPQNTFRQAVDRVPGGQMVRQMILPPKAEKDEMMRLLHTPYRTASPEDQRRIADMALNQSMMVGSVSPRKVPRIPKPTQGEMAGFIDYVRLKQPFSHQAELAASRIAEKYKLLNKTPKSTRGLANVFDRTLSKLNFR